MPLVIETNPGLFGKMPMLGDFVSRRMSAAFVDPWDDWLRRGMARSRAALGEDWLQLYLAGPVWRFALQAGVVTDKTVAGVLMPSVDAVNRHFPLTIAAVAAADPGPFTIAAEADAWFTMAERLALSCLEPRATVSSIELGLEALGPVPVGALPSPDVKSAGSLGLRWKLSADLPESLCSVCPHILDNVTAAMYGTFSLWWTAGSDEVEPALLLFSGLPPADAFSDLLRDTRSETPVTLHAG